MATEAELLAAAKIIKEETGVDKNTAARVGALLENIINRSTELDNKQVSYSVAQGKTEEEKAVARGNIGAAPLASPAFTGTPTAPTPAAGDNSTKVATTEFVRNSAFDLYSFAVEDSGRSVVRGVVLPVCSNKTIASYTPTTSVCRARLLDGLNFEGYLGTLAISNTSPKLALIYGDFSSINFDSAGISGDIESNITGTLNTTYNNVHTLFARWATTVFAHTNPNLSWLICDRATIIHAQNCNLDLYAIEALLIGIVGQYKSGGDIILSGGTNAAYSTWTQAAKDAFTTLISRGWTITKNS